MSTVIDKIRDLEHVSQFSKHEQLVRGIVDAIDERIVVQGNMLPSVNTMVKELGFASKTIVKAYDELKERGLIESKKRHGYYIINEDTDQTAKIALMMYAYHSFQEDFYNTFRNMIGENTQLDVYFHHNNIDVFENTLGNIIGQYSMYVIAPIHHVRTAKVLEQIPPLKLLMIDRFEAIQQEVSHITQEFYQSTLTILEELLPSIRKFDGAQLYFKEDSDFPPGVKKAFEVFTKRHKIDAQIHGRYDTGMPLKGKVHLTIGDGDLWRLLKDAKAKSLDIGKDLGILSHNNDPVKEIICGGITTYSTDFSQMAIEAAAFVKNRKPLQKTMPMILTRRNSL